MKRFFLLLLATSVVSVALSGLSASAGTSAADPIVGAWSSSSSPRVINVTQSGTTFVGTVQVAAVSTLDSPCVSPVGKQVWTITRQTDGTYTGTSHAWIWTVGGGPSTCQESSTTATWTIAAASGGTLSMVVNYAGPLYPNSETLTRSGSASAADFSIAVSPASATTAAGGSVVYTLSAKTSGGFTASLSISIGGLPAGTTYSGPAWTGSVAITVSTSKATPAGTYPLTFNATGGGITHSSPVSLVVTGNSTPPPTPAPTPVTAATVQACMNGGYSAATRGLSPIATAVACSKAAIGQPYCLGGKGVATGPPRNCPALSFDCAGLISMAYKAAGITVGATAQAQYNEAKVLVNGQPMTDRTQLQVGDLVFFDINDYQHHRPTSTDRIDHVGMIVSTSPTLMWISAPGTGQKLSTKPFQSGPVTTATWVGTARP